MIEAQARRDPSGVALVDGAQEWTFGDVSKNTDRVAVALQRRGVRPGDLVAICMQRCAGLVMGIVGILKAGAAYVPLDPDHPTDRIEFILRDTGVRHVLTEAACQHRVAGDSRDVLLLPGDGILVEESLDPPQLPAVASSDLAYVIYTSGSTGRPKGVMNAHGPVANRIDWMIRALGLGPGDRILLKTTITFDVSVWELLAPLCCGAQLIIAPPGVQADPLALAQIIIAAGVTHVHFVPSMLALFLDAPLASSCTSLRTIVASGETLLPAHVARTREVLGCALWNLYGPTEAAVDVTYHVCDPARDRDCVPIGRPISGARLYVVDAEGRVCPSGEAGELWIGGLPVARGYLQRDELTRTRFRPDPFTNEPGGRVYCTGDRVRLRADGELEFLGRLDDQVKIRGVRVEPLEVEAVLAECPGVREAAVVAHLHAVRGIELIGYVAARAGGDAVSQETLQALLALRLPAPLVPARILVLEELPHTQSGKIDRRALPPPDHWPAQHIRPEAQPQDPREGIVLDTWKAVLGTPSIGMEDHFLRLGGHSLLAVRIAFQLERALGVRLEIRDVLESGTPRGLALRCATAPPAAEHPRAVRSALMQLSPAQEAVWTHDALHPRDTSYTIPVAFRVLGRVDVPALQRALDTLAAAHEALRMGFTDTPAGPRLFIAPHVALPLQVEDRLGYAVEERPRAVRALAEELTREPFDLTRAPLARAYLFRLGRDDSGLVLTFHHLIMDAWSLETLLEELARAYGAPLGAPPLGTATHGFEFVDAIAWQRQRALGAGADDATGHWRRLLLESQPVRLPGDLAQVSSQTAKGASAKRSWAHAGVAALESASLRLGVTRQSVFAGAFAGVLGKFCGTTEAVFGVPVAERTGAAWERVIGFLISTAVVRVDLSDDPTLDQLGQRAASGLQAAIEHSRVPVAQVATSLRREGALPYQPTHFAFLNFLEPNHLDCPLGGALVEAVECWPTHAKFDITLYVHCAAKSVEVTAHYDATRLVAATIEDLLSAVERLVVGAAAAPSRSVRELPTLDPALAAPRQRRPQGRRERPDWPPAGSTLHEGVFARARRQPTATAVRSGPEVRTYAQLEQGARAVARAVLSTEAGPGPAGLLFSHGPRMLDGMLGALASGRAYAPMDPTLPDVRLLESLSAVQPRLLIVEPAHELLARRLLPSVPIVVVGDSCAARPEEAPTGVSENAPAYVLTTSGTTGRPKGVVQTHRGVLLHSRAWVDAVGIDSGDRLTCFSRYGFDSCAQDAFAALLTGAQLHLADVRNTSAGELWTWLGAQGTTVLHATPTVFRWLAGSTRTLPSLDRVRAVVLGGEAMTRDDLELFNARFSTSCVLINGLGLTESTVALQYRLGHGDSLQRQRVPVGFAVDGADATILDELGREVERVGELVLTSDRLALGYVGIDNASADPFESLPDGRRRYRTGDLVRRLEDGSLEFLGRTDFQVKVRGVRIELGDVEAALRLAPGATDAIVVAFPAPDSGEWRLAAHVVPDLGGALDPVHVREFARRHLPAEFVPQVIRVGRDVPRLPNGKPDRVTLSRAAREARTETPRGEHVETPTELRLKRLWQDLLRAPTVQVTDEFLHIGGSSLLNIEMLDRVAREWGVRLPTAVLVEAPSLRELARRIDGAREGGASLVSRVLVPLRPEGDGPPLFCLTGRGGSVLSYLPLARALRDCGPVWGIEVEELDLWPGALDSVETMARAACECMRRVQPRGPYRVLGYSFGGLVAWEIARSLSAMGEHVEFVGLIDTWLVGVTRDLRWHEKLKKHLTAVVASSPRASGAYVGTRLRRRARALLGWLGLGVSAGPSALPGDDPRRAAVHRACGQAALAYRPGAYAGDAWFFKAMIGPEWKVERPDVRCGGWDALAPGRVRQILLECRHLDFFKDAQLPSTVAAVTAALHDASRSRR